MEAGLRVVRGPDWAWGGQDGAEGYVGTITKPSKSQETVVFNGCIFVLWDCGHVANYRVGHQESYDLSVLDTSQIGSKHVGVKCNECGKADLIGLRWKCTKCENYNLCNGCYTSDRHALSHAFLRYDLPTSKGVPVPPRSQSRKVEAMGIYAGATVIRGPDWRWGDQDGGEGSPGLICEITDKHDSQMYQSWCKVTWEKAGSNEYRRGHEGALDVCCVLPSSGGFYYPTHLAWLGKDFDEKAVKCVQDKSSESSSGSGEIRVGDKVTIALEPDVFQALQEGHGGWNEMMAKCVGKEGRVISKMDCGDFVVHFEKFKKPWRINPIAISKQVDSSCFKKGDLVKIADDEALVSTLQNGHGGWIPAMKQALGKVWRIVQIDSDGDVRVNVDGHRWSFNPRCCTVVEKARKKTSSESSSSSDEDAGAIASGPFLERLRRLQGAVGGSGELLAAATGDTGPLMEQMLMMQGALSNPQQLVAAAANGVALHVREIVSKHPDQVDVRNCGKTALQMACLRGHSEVVEILINAGADITARDDDGDMPVHFAVIEDRAKCLETLIACGADINLVNYNLLSPLHMAVRKGHRGCIEVLLRNNCSTNLKDNMGDTALHDAISCNNNELVELLIAAPGFDFQARNQRGFNILHQATLSGNSRAVELILRKVPDLVNVKKEDGMTPLHVAAINGHGKVAEMLITVGKANMEAVNVVGHTALQVAVLQNKMPVVEAIVTKGANVNVVDVEGNTPLHTVLLWMKNENMELLKSPKEQKLPQLKEAPLIAEGESGQTPRRESEETWKQPMVEMSAGEDEFLVEVKSNLAPGLQNLHWLPVAVFLVRHGANLQKANRNGKTPLDLVADSRPVMSVLQSQSSSLSSHSSLLNRTLSNPSECVMCSDNPVQVTFKPCGHRIACHACGQRMKKCFVCKCVLVQGVARQESSVRCTLCDRNDRNVVFLCGHGCCDECSKNLKACHICGESTDNCLTLFKRN